MRTRMLVLVLMALAVGGVFAQNKVSETILPNGLRVLIKEVHSAPVFTSQVWYNVGSGNEHTGITGISHLLEHMMFKGTKTVGKGEFARIIQAKGGQQNAATYIDWTYYWEMMSTENLELALKLEADRMTNALLDPKEFNLERVVVRSELEGNENDPDRVLFHEMYSAAYQVHPYQWPTIGWLSDVEHISRDQLYRYYKIYYHPNNATLVIVGDVNTAKTLALVKKHFGRIAAGPKPPPVYTAEPVQNGEKRFVLRREGTAERVMIGYHIPKTTDPDLYPLMLLDNILSGGRSSRLYQALVEGQLATSAWSSTMSAKYPGMFLVGATARQGIHSDQMEKALLEEVEKAKSAPPSVDELTRAKNQLEAYLVFQNDSVSDQAEQLGNYATIATWQYLDTLLPKVKAVKAEDVQRVARKYLTDDNRTVGWFVPTGPPSGGVEAGPSAGRLHNHRPSRMASHYSKGAPAAVISQKPIAKPTASRTVLSNGLVVIVQENHSNGTIAVRGNLNAGSYFDPAGKRGLASLTAGILSRGTQSRTALQIAQELDFVGASMGFTSDTEGVRFSGKALSKDTGLILDILSDELRRPSIPKDQVDKLKAQNLSQLEQEKENPEMVADREFKRAIFPEGHPYRPESIDGEEASIRSLDRDDLVSFHETFYGPETTVIVIVGDIRTDDALATVKKYFGDWKPTGPARKVVIPDVPSATKAQRVVIPVEGKSQVNVAFGYPGRLARSNPDFYAGNVMNFILGGSGLESRLGVRIRDDMGLVYFVYSYFDASLGAGPWGGAFGTNPANTDKAIAAAIDVIAGYAKTGPTAREFKDAIDYLVGSFPIRLETNEGVAGVLLNSEVYGLGMDYIRKYASNYRALTLDQVKAAARKYLHPDEISVIIAGPYRTANRE